MIGGIFVGGSSSRMGRAKGLLRAPEGLTLIARWQRLLRDAGARPVLVGRRPEYAQVDLPVVDDAAPGLGPLGGLVGLLRAAREERAIAVACDMPFVSPALLARLVAASEAPVVAPRRDGRWEPLFASFDPPRVLALAEARAARGELALQGLLDAAGATELPLGEGEDAELRDWDTPRDVTA